MNFREELRDLLNECRTDTNVGVSRAIDQIIELIDKEIIGERERTELADSLYAELMDIRNELRASQREKLEEVEGK